jgi:hypothetical protein
MSGMRSGCPFSPLLFNIVLVFLAWPLREEQEIKGVEIWKWVIKQSLFTDDVILYIKDPKISTKKHLEIINTLSKVGGYKISAQKLVAFLYINNEQTEKEIKETVWFILALKE